MAKPRELSKGKWRLDSCYNGQRKTFRGSSSKEVKQKEREWQREIDDYGDVLEKKKTCFIDLTREYLFVMVKPNVTPGTFEKYLSIFENHAMVYSCLNKDVKNITVNDLQNVFNETYKKSRSSIKMLKIILKGSLDYAVLNNLIRTNPISGIKLPKGCFKQETKIEYFTLEEQEKYLNYAKNTVYYELLVLALNTGMRQGELTALRWKDIDLDNSIIHITNSSRRVRMYDDEGNFEYNVVIGKAKTENSIRDIPFSNEISIMLKKLKLKNGGLDKDFVFLSAKGEQIKNDTLKKMHGIFCKRAGIKHIKFHALRHTFATRAIEQGIDVRTISDIMGHGDVSITLNLYVHTDENKKRDAIEKISKLISTL